MSWAKDLEVGTMVQRCGDPAIYGTVARLIPGGGTNPGWAVINWATGTQAETMLNRKRILGATAKARGRAYVKVMS